MDTTAIKILIRLQMERICTKTWFELKTISQIPISIFNLVVTDQWIRNSEEKNAFIKKVIRIIYSLFDIALGPD